MAVVATAALAVAATASTAPGQTTVALTSQPIHHSATLAPNGLTTFTVTCPKGYAASSGGVTAPVFGTVALKSAPSAAGSGWTFRFLNKTAQAQTVMVVVTCVKPRPLKLPKLKASVVPAYSVKSVKAAIAAIGAGERKTVKVTCPKDYAPVGSGYDLQPGGKRLYGARLAEDAFPAVTFSHPVQGGWEWSVQGGTARGAAELTATCGPRIVRAKKGKRRGSRRVTVTRQTAVDRLNAGANRIQHPCRTGVAVGAGFGLPGGRPIDVHGAAADSTADGLWYFFLDIDRPAGETTVETYLLCAT
jgi:hypothetical protein